MFYGGVIYFHPTAENSDSNIYQICIKIFFKKLALKSADKVIQYGEMCVYLCVYVYDYLWEFIQIIS